METVLILSVSDVQLVIAGFDGSTEMASLVDAFKSIDIQVTLPGLKTDLLNSAALKGTSIRLNQKGAQAHVNIQCYPQQARTTLAMSLSLSPIPSVLLWR